jgi:glycosyltransferase involved in cell wall biosynthesis
MNQSNPEISVIMSVYNEPLKWIENSIKSILNQSFNNFEFIIINDNPYRKEIKIFLNDYKTKDKRIKIIHNALNCGAASSRNKGLRKANGRYIAIMDSDDISLPDRLKIQYDYLESHPEFFLIGGKFYYMDEFDNIINPSETSIDSLDIQKHIHLRNYFCHPTIMFRNERFLYRSKFLNAQDYDLYLRLASSGKKLTNINNFLINYRIGRNSISFSGNSKQRVFSKLAKQFYKERVETGKDSYNNLTKSKIELYYKQLSKDKDFLRNQIYYNYLSFNFKYLRKNARCVLKDNRFEFKIILMYALSFMGVRINRCLRKIFGFSKIYIRKNILKIMSWLKNE